MSEELFSVKMRSSKDGAHVSGAERIVAPGRVADVAKALVRRVRQPFDFLNIKIEAVRDPVRLDALPVVSHIAATPEEGWRIAEGILRSAGFSRISEIRKLFAETYSVRGAMLLDADTLERLEPDRERGIRATSMDGEPSPSAAVKDHFAEALTLATKVEAAPGIVGEICVSDDPGYVTGYVATHEAYHRISVLKEAGSPLGGRIFLYRGKREGVADAIAFLEKTPVIIRALPGAAQNSALPGTARDTYLPRATSCAAPGRARFSQELAAIEAAGLTRKIRTYDFSSGELVNFASNDYLALANDERVKRAAAEAALKYGAGAGASRLVTGTLPPHIALERHLAAHKGCEDAIVFPTGYMANVGAISALAGKDDVILSDELNHASIIDGCRLSGAEVQVYRHLDYDELETRLSRCRAFRRRIVVSDGVFSMDGDVLERERFTALCDRYNAFAYIDDAHSVVPRDSCLVPRDSHSETADARHEARGTRHEARGTRHEILMGTLSKALGSLGGYVAGTHETIEYLRQRARAFIFSTASNPSAMAAADMALTIIENEPQHIQRLCENIRIFCEAMGRPPAPSPIVPVIIGDEREAVAASQELEKRGFIIPAIRYPTVPRGQARLRIALNAAHTREHLLTLANFLKNAIKHQA